jgi:hypothetical protein
MNLEEARKLAGLSEGWFSSKQSEPVTDATVKTLTTMFEVLRTTIDAAEKAIETKDSAKLTKALQTIVKTGEILQKRFGS